MERGHIIAVEPYGGIQNRGFDDSDNHINLPKRKQNGIVSDSEDFILALFVVVFDTKRGNEVEWFIPQQFDPGNVEFKAITSGSHNVYQDFVYFKHNGHYGLSCFQRLCTANQEERGARMKSVGIICKKYTSLHKHMSFLEGQARQQLERPKHYSDLLRYYKHYKKCPNKNNSVPSPLFETIPHIDELPVMKITHPAGCFSQFLKFFGEKIFALWRLILLQKRVLFFCPPPAGVACYRVYCTCLLGSHAIPFVTGWNTNPLFYVNVMDMTALEKEHRYVACTTEKIFESKPDVYDVFVDNQNIVCNSHLEQLGRTNAADKDRYRRLLAYSTQEFIRGGDVTDDEKTYTRFFIEQNNRIFKILFEIASRENRSLSLQAMLDMGLDPTQDRLFVALLVDLYSINVVVPELGCCGARI